jgi:two-component system sensor histidine kinase YesM
MSITKKLLIGYLSLTSVLIILVAFSFYHLNVKTVTREAERNLKTMTSQVSGQIDNVVNTMDFIMIDLLSDSDFYFAIDFLANNNQAKQPPNVYFNECWSIINEKLVSYSILKNVYRIDVYNGQGDFFSSMYSRRFDIPDAVSTMEEIVQIDDIRKLEKTLYIMPPFIDPWEEEEPDEIFSILRVLSGSRGSVTCMEVQLLAEDFDKIFEPVTYSNMDILVLTKEDKILYCNNDEVKTIWEYYDDLSEESEVYYDIFNPNIGRYEKVYSTESAEYGLKVIMIQERGKLLKDVTFLRNTTIVGGVIVFLISFAFAYFIINKITNPLRQLKTEIEKTELANLPKSFEVESSNDEIKELANSYNRLKERLNLAIIREIESEQSNMQAKMDSLQAQINPHFLNNILNIIANKGIILGDDEICQMCEGIAEMLRYSTSTEKRDATIEQEISHVSHYLNLMKKRYEDCLQYEIEIDPKMKDFPIPKIVLQTFVENAIIHGYKNDKNHMMISIKGYIEKDQWYIDIMDNGEGIAQKKIDEILTKCVETEYKIFLGDRETGFKIGGMGIVNTYARLKLFYRDKMIFYIGNRSEGGTLVRIGASIQRERFVNEKSD